MNISSELFDKLLLSVQKPGRYSGGEMGSIVKDKEKVDVRFAFCFPDIYEIGMSHLGMKILYSLFNEREDIWCERVFAPWTDFEEVMRENNIPLFALESRDPIADFDFIGFTLQYELCYTNILNMLDLAGVPVRSRDRGEDCPIVVAGGPCVCNPEPIADFIDIIFLGEGEEVDLEVIDLYKECKGKVSRQEFLQKAALIPGVYVPSLYDVEYNADGTIGAVVPKCGAPKKVTKRIIEDLDKCYYPKTFVTPYIDIVHNRAVEEIFRGCIRGCRFCQAGFIYRPVREKSIETINSQAKDLCSSTGYREMSLASLSTSDYSDINSLLESLVEWTDEEKISLNLPSLRVDNFSEEIIEKTAAIRKSGLTFAPEAGTQRLRDVINKNVTEEEIFRTCGIAFRNGYTAVKLYFMCGLPTETEEDLQGILDLGQKIVNLYYSMEDRKKGRPVNVSISVSFFVPKPFTPFQFEPQITKEEIEKSQKYLKTHIPSKKISLSYHDSSTGFLEGIFARGDRKLCDVIYNAWKNGSKFDSWDEYFNLDLWLSEFEKLGLDPAFYANRRREYDEVLPWDHLDYLVDKSFFINENKKAYSGETTPNCKQKCSACGAMNWCNLKDKR